MSKAPAAKTTQEAVRLPLADQKKKDADEVAGFKYDHKKYDYVLVEDKIPGVRMNQRDINYYKRLGFDVASKDGEVTGHEALTLMARPKKIGDEHRRKESIRNNRDKKRPGEMATRAELAEGVVQIEKKALRLKDMGGALPDESEIRRRNKDIEERTAGLEDNPILQHAAMTNLEDIE